MSLTDQCCGHTIKKTVNVGENAVITCKYPESNQGNVKYLYKKHDGAIFSQCASSDLSQQTRKYSLIDERAGMKSFNVTIWRLTLADAGVYWCGVGTGGDTHSTSLIEEVELHVSEYANIGE